LVEDVIHPVAFESQAQISEDIGEMREQLRKQVNRLRELRIKKIEEPGISRYLDIWYAWTLRIITMNRRVLWS
jgi:hypothetical protein